MENEVEELPTYLKIFVYSFHFLYYPFVTQCFGEYKYKEIDVPPNFQRYFTQLTFCGVIILTLFLIKKTIGLFANLLSDITISSFLLIFSTNSLCQSQSVSTNMQGELSLLWTDEFKNPIFGVVQDKPYTDKDTSTSRSDLLGLKKARFQFDFSNGQKSKLTIAIRPDTLKSSSDQKLTQELDTRMGPVLDPAPSVQFLDGYEIQLTPFKALSASFGVFEYLNQTIEAYQSNLDFGLEIRPVTKSSGLWLRWLPEGQQGRNIVFDVILFQGNDERGEFISESSRDPRSTKYSVPGDRKNGGALSCSLQASKNNYVYGFLSYHESQNIRQIDNARLYLQIGTTYDLSLKSHDFAIALDTRYMRESFRQDSIDNEETIAELNRSHWSSKISINFELVPEFFFLSNLQYGVNHIPFSSEESDLNQDAKVREVHGSQIEMGLRSGDVQGINTQLLLTEESRKIKGNQVASFLTRENSLRNSIQRISLGVSYRFNSRI
jgi:hypothetical protein